MATYDIEIDWQTPEQKELVEELQKWGLWGEEEATRKAPHAVSYLEYECEVPLTNKEARRLKEHMLKTYEEKGGYVIRDIKIREQLA